MQKDLETTMANLHGQENTPPDVRPNLVTAEEAYRNAQRIHRAVQRASDHIREERNGVEEICRCIKNLSDALTKNGYEEEAEGVKAMLPRFSRRLERLLEPYNAACKACQLTAEADGKTFDAYMELSNRLNPPAAPLEKNKGRTAKEKHS